MLWLLFIFLIIFMSSYTIDWYNIYINLTKIVYRFTTLVIVKKNINAFVNGLFDFQICLSTYFYMPNNLIHHLHFN